MRYVKENLVRVWISRLKNKLAQHHIRPEQSRLGRIWLVQTIYLPFISRTFFYHPL